MPRREVNNTRCSSRPTIRKYSRSSDCWNCGLPYHVSKDCKAPRIIRCSFCRKPGVRSDTCDCHKGRKATVKRLGRGQDNRTFRFPKQYESIILVSICGKKIKAVINTGVQTSRIGLRVFRLIEEQTKVKPKRKIFKSQLGLELANTIVIDAGISDRRLYPMECIIDPKLPQNDMILGMKAMVTFGYRVSVAGKEAQQRLIVQRNKGGRPQNQKRRNTTGNISSTSKEFHRLPFLKSKHNQESDAQSNSDDCMSFLDEEEAVRIREWRY